MSHTHQNTRFNYDGYPVISILDLEPINDRDAEHRIMVAEVVYDAWIAEQLRDFNAPEVSFQVEGV